MLAAWGSLVRGGAVRRAPPVAVLRSWVALGLLLLPGSDARVGRPQALLARGAVLVMPEPARPVHEGSPLPVPVTLRTRPLPAGPFEVRVLLPGGGRLRLYPRSGVQLEPGGCRVLGGTLEVTSGRGWFRVAAAGRKARLLGCARIRTPCTATGDRATLTVLRGGVQAGGRYWLAGACLDTWDGRPWHRAPPPRLSAPPPPATPGPARQETPEAYGRTPAPPGELPEGLRASLEALREEQPEILCALLDQVAARPPGGRTRVLALVVERGTPARVRRALNLASIEELRRMQPLVRRMAWEAAPGEAAAAVKALLRLGDLDALPWVDRVGASRVHDRARSLLARPSTLLDAPSGPPRPPPEHLPAGAAAVAAVSDYLLGRPALLRGLAAELLDGRRRPGGGDLLQLWGTRGVHPLALEAVCGGEPAPRAMGDLRGLPGLRVANPSRHLHRAPAVWRLERRRLALLRCLERAALRNLRHPDPHMRILAVRACGEAATRPCLFALRRRLRAASPGPELDAVCGALQRLLRCGPPDGSAPKAFWNSLLENLAWTWRTPGRGLIWGEPDRP